MRTSRFPICFLALMACGGTADDRAASGDTTSTAAAPSLSTRPPTLGADTMAAAGGWRCDDGSVWNVTVWRGPGARVVLSSDDTTYGLPQEMAASGVRYADSMGTTWWNKGDSATFLRGERSTTCAAAADVEF